MFFSSKAAVRRDPLEIQSVTQDAIQSGELSRQDHLMLSSAMLSSFDVTTDDRHRINRVFDYIRQRRVRLVD